MKNSIETDKAKALLSAQPEPRFSLRYLCAARYAAKLERLKQYEEATIAWRYAYGLAQARINQLWSESRADFCLIQSLREKTRQS